MPQIPWYDRVAFCHWTWRTGQIGHGENITTRSKLAVTSLDHRRHRHLLSPL